MTKAFILLLLLLISSAVLCAPTGLNTIPTTDLVPVGSWIGQIQNTNTSFTSPTFYNMPLPVLQSQFAINPRVEAGLDFMQPPSVTYYEGALNAKYLVDNENETRPGLAVGILNIAGKQSPSYYLTMSKTLNYDEQQRERFRAHHRRNRKLLGRRIHVGLTYDGRGVFLPLVGTDLQLNERTVLQADWISGGANSATLGASFILPDQRTVLNPAFVVLNNTHRVGVFINLSRQFNL
jgi:hypothetical protein